MDLELTTANELELSGIREAIGAIGKGEKGAPGGVAELDESGLNAQPPKLHAATHEPGGSDPLTGYARRIVVVEEDTDARTLTADDEGMYIRTTSGDETTITVPPQSAVEWPDNATVLIEQGGAGPVVIEGGAGVTIHAAAELATRTQHSVIVLVRVAEGVWTVFGDLAL